ncbi:MAG: hypothetical protein ACP5FX_01255 [Candidatus Micrarchaeia archaeon]|jgi:hypothetical protein
MIIPFLILLSSIQIDANQTIQVVAQNSFGFFSPQLSKAIFYLERSLNSSNTSEADFYARLAKEYAEEAYSQINSIRGFALILYSSISIALFFILIYLSLPNIANKRISRKF